MKGRFDIHGGGSSRLTEYAFYPPGASFITAVTQYRLFLFGHVEHGRMALSTVGEFVQRVWRKIPDRIPRIKPHACVIMSDYAHAVLFTTRDGTFGDDLSTHVKVRLPSAPGAVLSIWDDVSIPVGAGLVPGGGIGVAIQTSRILEDDVSTPRGSSCLPALCVGNPSGRAPPFGDGPSCAPEASLVPPEGR